jgi:fructose-bisphosphate aldolase, class I
VRGPPPGREPTAGAPRAGGFRRAPEHAAAGPPERVRNGPGCNVATTFGILGAVSRTYAHRVPFIVKMNHNELLTYPNKFDQIMFGTVRQVWDLGAAGVGATIYFRSEESTRQIQPDPGGGQGVRRGS